MEEKTGSLASEFQLNETACNFIHQTRMYAIGVINEKGPTDNPLKYGEKHKRKSWMELWSKESDFGYGNRSRFYQLTT